ncbi:pyruvate dehydrogenase (acetyl-transferring) E1 component, alpha subunit [mine drainage metagenome]|uniref:Pyruvate dehydrogenase (Acetyl-transferring) E1 component, alpha subunit n=2 Tax=mine drainage metagenome TaxID=410659 RepID=T1A4H1_9ZZZZ
MAQSTTARFEIKRRAYLSPEGTLTGSPPGIASDPELLIRLYRMMVLVRIFDSKAVALQRTGQLGTYASCLGHEAIHVGIGAAMAEDDVFFPMYREYGTQLWRGVHMDEILAFWGGDERGNAFRDQPHDFPWAVPIATQTLHAAGAALAFKLRGEPRVAVAVIGDGGTSQGDFYEALNASGAFKAPCVFVIANNQWAISVPLKQQTACATLAQKAIAAGIPGEQVDGNDILAVQTVMAEAIARARTGGGPSLIEALTYRLSDHTTADDARRYRASEEVEAARGREPIGRFKRFLLAKRYWDEEREAALLSDCQREVDEAVQAYLALGKPKLEDLFDYTFAELPESLRAQRDGLITGGANHG